MNKTRNIYDKSIQIQNQTNSETTTDVVADIWLLPFRIQLGIVYENNVLFGKQEESLIQRPCKATHTLEETRTIQMAERCGKRMFATIPQMFGKRFHPFLQREERFSKKENKEKKQGGCQVH